MSGLTGSIWCFGNFLEISVGLFLIGGSPEHSKKLSFSSWLALKWLLPPFQHLGFRIQHLFRQYVMWWRRRTYKYWFPIQPPRRLRLLRSKSHPEELLLASQLPLQSSLLPDSQLNINMISSYHYKTYDFRANDLRFLSNICFPPLPPPWSSTKGFMGCHHVGLRCHPRLLLLLSANFNPILVYFEFKGGCQRLISLFFSLAI